MPPAVLTGLPWSTDFLRQIHLPGADAEIGLALSVCPGRPGLSRLLSYNPRTRAPAFRRRVQQTLQALGFTTGWLTAIGRLLPARQGSWILGIEDSSGRLSGTLYIEELSRFFSPPALDGLWHGVADALGLPLPGPLSQGAPYILAIDFEPTGPVCLKRYHLTEGARPVHRPGLPPLLQQTDAGHILQRRGGDDSLKVYRCYDYQHTPAKTAWSHWRALSGLSPPAGMSHQTPITSIGARLRDGSVSALVLYTAPRTGTRR